jgi:hypothetical protein
MAFCIAEAGIPAGMRMSQSSVLATILFLPSVDLVIGYELRQHRGLSNCDSIPTRVVVDAAVLLLVVLYEEGRLQVPVLVPREEMRIPDLLIGRVEVQGEVLVRECGSDSLVPGSPIIVGHAWII